MTFCVIAREPNTGLLGLAQATILYRLADAAHLFAPMSAPSAHRPIPILAWGRWPLNY